MDSAENLAIRWRGGARRALTLVGAQRPSRARPDCSPALWEVSGLPGAKAPLRECVADTVGARASSSIAGSALHAKVISDSASSTVGRI